MEDLGQERQRGLVKGAVIGQHVRRRIDIVRGPAHVGDAAAGFLKSRGMTVMRGPENLSVNGDIGLLLPDSDSGEPRAFFPGPDNTLRKFLPLRLPEHETAYAMTVHKSQGSEFDRVLLILPDRDSPVLSRELLYTGITRARTSVELWFDEKVFRAALARRVTRTSGLCDALQ